MRLTLRAGLLTAPLFLLSLTSNAFADYVVDSVNPAWNQEGTDATFVLPATIPGCGTENATTCEPVGDFLISTAFAGPTNSGYATITDEDGITISDYLVYDNTGPGGLGEIKLYSDPSAPINLPSFSADSQCTETAGAGCTLTGLSLNMADGGILLFNLASDGEASFDPYGAGYDTSDGIQFTNATVGPVPEPSSLFGIGGLALVLAGSLRRKLSR